MADTSHYDTAKALMASVTARAKFAAKARGQQPDLLLRQFEFSRLLARVFASESAENWVLKGGVAALARVRDGRMTRDVDLFHQTRQANLDQAVAEFEAAMAIDLGDHFTFRVVDVRAIPEKTGRVGAAGRGLVVSVRSAKSSQNIPIDIVADSVMTGTPDVAQYESVPVPGIEPPAVRLYPVVDHMADKIAATHTLFGSTRRSTRVRDMADLVLFATHKFVDGADLHRAIATEWAYREFEGDPQFDPPEEWRPAYATMVRDLDVINYKTFDTARDLLARFLDPALSGEADGYRWNPLALNWEKQ